MSVDGFSMASLGMPKDITSAQAAITTEQGVNTGNEKVVGKIDRALNKRINNKEKAKDILRSRINKIDNRDLKDGFNKFKDILAKDKILMMKALLLKNITNKYKQKENENNKNDIERKFLNWRLLSIPREDLGKIKRIMQGISKLGTALRKPDGKTLLDEVKSIAKARETMKILYKLVKDNNAKLKIMLKRRSYDLWKERVPDIQKAKDHLEKMLKAYPLTKKMHRKMFTEPENNIVRACRNYDRYKRKKSKPISIYFMGILDTNWLIKKMNLALNMKKFYLKRLNANKDRMRKALAQWNTKVYEMMANENIGVIQNFLRGVLNKPNEKRKKLDQLGDAVKKILERNIFDKLGQEAKEQLLKATNKAVRRNNKENEDLLRDKFKLWKNLLPKLAEEDASISIQNAFRNLRSRKKRDELKQRIPKIYERFSSDLQSRYGKTRS